MIPITINITHDDIETFSASLALCQRWFPLLCVLLWFETHMTPMCSSDWWICLPWVYWPRSQTVHSWQPGNLGGSWSERRESTYVDDSSISHPNCGQMCLQDLVINDYEFYIMTLRKLASVRNWRYKIRRYQDRIIFIMEFSIHGMMVLILRRGPDVLVNVSIDRKCKDPWHIFAWTYLNTFSNSLAWHSCFTFLFKCQWDLLLGF